MGVLVHLMVFTFVMEVTLGFATSHALQLPWTVACFWTKDFNSKDNATELCNHIIYQDFNTSIIINLNTLTLDANHFDQDEGYLNVKSFKERNNEVRVELQIGHWQTPKRMYDIARTQESRKKFINSSIEVLKLYRFDGLHLMWGSPAPDAREYFINSSTAKREKENLTHLLRELNKTLTSANLSFSFGVRGVLEIDCNMEVKEVYANADLVFLYAYNYHGSWEEYTGAFAPIYPESVETERVNSYYMTVDATWDTLQVWGGKPEKTVLVVNAKGNPFKLTNTSQHGINAPHKSDGTMSPHTFKEICKKQTEANWTIVWDNTRKQSYTYRGNSWITYEDACSVIEKKKYAREKKFRGLALKDLSRDDANGDCVRKTLSLLHTRKNSDDNSNHDDHNDHDDDNDNDHDGDHNDDHVYLDTTFPLLRIIAEEREQSNPCNTSCKNYNFRNKLQLLILLVFVQFSSI